MADLNEAVVTVNKLSYPAASDVWNSTGGGFAFCSGHYQNRIPVYLKRMAIGEASREVQRELYALKLSGNVHENIVRFIASENDASRTFTYIATELCFCSVADLYRDNQLSDEQEQSIRSSIGDKSMVRQMAEGVAFLHGSGLIHRNLKPNNFMIAQVGTKSDNKFLVKLTDMGKSKTQRESDRNSKTQAADYWIAPEMESVQTLDPKIDTFTLGCVFFYVLSGGNHPFGIGMMRRVNITNKYFDVYQSRWNPKLNADGGQAVNLIKTMIQYNQSRRPTVKTVLSDGYFEPNESYDLYGDHADRAGLCVIFNQKNFMNKETRQGTDQDCNRLRDTFLALGYDVYIRTDVRGRDMYEYDILQLAHSDIWNSNKYASLIICILSHGTEGAASGIGNVGVRINKLKYAFNSKDCPGLHGKPKVFIVQACQGGSHLSPTASSDATPVSPSEKKSASALPLLHPPIMDLLDLTSTAAGFDGYRDPETGSHFIQSLCDQLDSEEPVRKNICDVFDRVQVDVAKDVPWTNGLAKRMGQLGTSLQKHVCFQKVLVDKRGEVLKESDIM